jgi:HAE1 family hydrophobic/amphiphilic exporter-1
MRTGPEVNGFRRWLPAQAYDRPVTVLMAFIALLVIGVIAWYRVPVQLMPSGFELNHLWVWVPYPDGSPAETDEEVVRPIEAQLGTVPGIKHVRSNATTGYASFAIEFHQAADMDVAYNDVVDRLERAMPDLPEEIERYGVFKYNPDDEPIVWAGVTFPDTVADPYHVMTRVVQPRLERIPGVAAIDLWGVPERSVYIDYDREKVVAHGVDLGGLQRRLFQDNFQMSGGRIQTRGQDLYVRSLARLETVEDLRRYPVQEGLVLGDIADVRFRSAISYDINRIDGQVGAAMAVRKESTANAVEVAGMVAEALDGLEGDERAEGAGFHIFFSQAEIIEDSMGTLTQTALVGGVFAVIILLAFLREWRMTLLISASIPFSLLITVGVLYFRGGTLNILSLMGLMLAVGMVVDNAIVVVETVYRRRADGAGARAAAVEGTAEVNLAIVLSTLTTMVVFLPIILMSDDAAFSFFMGELGFPVIFALAASLVVALIFAPLATKYIGRAQVKADARWLAWLTERYTRFLTWVLNNRADATFALLAVILLTAIIPMRSVECVDEGEGNINDFMVRYTVPRQADIHRRDQIVRVFEDLVANHQEEWGIRVYRTRLRDNEFQGRMWVYLLPETAGDREEVIEAFKEKLPDDIPGVEAAVGWHADLGAAGGNTLTVTLHGEEMETLRDLADEVARRARTMGGVLGAHVDLSTEGADEIHLVADRQQLDRYGLSARSVGQTVSYAMRGSRLPEMTMGEREVDVISRFEEADREDIDTLRDFPLWSPTTGQIVPLRAVTDVRVSKGPGAIRRHDRRTAVEVTVDLAKDVPVTRGAALIEAATADMVFPRGYSLEQGDRVREHEEDTEAEMLALVLSITFVFLLMGVLFESFVLPLCIITTVPMAMFGAWWGLYITGTTMDIMAGVGLVILVGVVVNNGIVLLDLVTQLRAEGMPRTQALVTAGRRRIRPILMTALTTICGLIPMAVGSSSFIGIPYAPLGRTVMSGMAAGTVLTLLFVPFLYTVLDDLRVGARRWLAYIRIRPERRGTEAVGEVQ